MLLAQELALVALDPDRGRHRVGERSQLNAALAGLLVAELILDGHARPEGRPDRIVVEPAAGVPSDPVLAATAEVVAERGPKVKPILSSLDRGLRNRLGTGTWDSTLAGLERAGVVGAPSGVFQRRQVFDPAVREQVLARLRAAAAGTGPIEPRTAVVVSMTGPARLLEVVAPERRSRKHARRRIDTTLEGGDLDPVGEAVRSVIADAAAMAIGAGTAVIAGSSS